MRDHCGFSLTVCGSVCVKFMACQVVNCERELAAGALKCGCAGGLKVKWVVIEKSTVAEGL